MDRSPPLTGMNFGRQFVSCVVLIALSLGLGCQTKKHPFPVKAQAPTLSVPLPDQIAEEEETPPPPPPEPTQQAVVTEPPKPKPKRSPKKPPQPIGNAQNSAASPTATTTIATARPAPNPAGEATPDTAIAAEVSHEQLTQQKQTTTQLLEATEKDLRGLNRSLSHDEEAMVTQIKSYIAQSRKAASDGDFERAYNLATKAHLLSDALVKK